MCPQAPFGWRAGELTVEKVPSSPIRALLLAVAGVEVRGIVITEEHQDGDPVERADAWHGLERTSGSDRFDASRQGAVVFVNLTRSREEPTQPVLFSCV
jgi:hypothetical protein